MKKRIFSPVRNWLVFFVVAQFFNATLLSQVAVIDTFRYSGSTQTFVIPQCATGLTFHIHGASGYTGQGYQGYGGTGTAVITPTPGVTLFFNIGGTGSVITGGFNGGGNGGHGFVTNGSGGGGATDIRLGGNTLAHRIIVLGGGGGSGVQLASAGFGGNGGGLSCTTWSNTTVLNCMAPWGCSGENGSSLNISSWNSCLGYTPTANGNAGGGGGLLSAGAPAYFTGGCYGSAGGLGYGGNGGDSACSNGGAHTGMMQFGGAGGGGGGGGYYGGAGGRSDTFTGFPLGATAGGGGGGSTYFDSSLVLSYRLFGYGGAFSNGHGMIVVRYTTNAPAISVSASSSTICLGSSVSLTATGVSSYSWLPLTGFPGSGNAAITVNPIHSTQYTVTGGNSSGCHTQSVITIVVNNPSLQVSAVPGPSACTGGTITLTASGANVYVWSGGVLDGVPFSPTATAVYSVTGTDQQGCSASATIQIGVGAQTIPIAGAKNICAGSSLTLSASPGFLSYQWNTGDTTTVIILSPTLSGVYLVQGSSPGSSCQGNGSVQVVVYPNPVVHITASRNLYCAGEGPVVLSASGAITYTYYSLPPSTYTISSGVEMVTPSSTMVYTVVGAAITQCSGTATIAIIKDDCAAINEQRKTSFSFFLFPNPSPGEVIISGPVTQLYVYDAIGKVVKSLNIIDASNGRYIVTGLLPGVYMVSALINNARENQRLVVY